MQSYPKTLLILTLTLLLCACSPVSRRASDLLTPTPVTRSTATAISVLSPTIIPSTPSRTPTPTITLVPLQPTATLSPLSAAEREKLFNEVWETVQNNYVYEDYRGLDWQAIRAEYAPRAATAETMDIFYEHLREMILRLEDDHTRFESPQDVAEEAARFNGAFNYGGIGAIVRIIDEGGLIVRLADDSPAAEAGLQPRDLILEIEGTPISNAEAFGPAGPIAAVRGQPGSRIQLTIQSPGQPPRIVDVTRRAIPADAFVPVEAHYIPGTPIGLLRIDTFNTDALDQQVRTSLESLARTAPLEGLLIDVRANSGGRVDLLLKTLGIFVDGGVIGSQQGRTYRSTLIVPEDETMPLLDGVPIVVLIGPETVSAAEMFAAGLQTLGRAHIVGMPSAGNTENLRGYNFSDGSRLWLAELTFRLPDDSLIEERGVQPDRIVDADWWHFTPETDPQIQAALDDIQSN